MARKPEAAKRLATAHVRFVSDSMREIERQGTEIIRVSMDHPLAENAETATESHSHA
jgi:GntR family transcriptional regulator, glc operon transcriptional activator